MGRADRSGRMPALALFVLSPFVAELLLGTIAIDRLGVGLVVAPLYGGGALLVRETARSRRGGWPAILWLALAFGVIEEGVVVQTLFNPNYLGLDLLREAHVSRLGIGGWWSLFVLTLHTIWSISVPIALVESLFPDRARVPWLGRVGLFVAGMLFLLGAWVVAYFTYVQEKFVASAPQIGGALLVAMGAVAVAFHVREGRPGAAGSVPHPLVVSLLSLVAASAFMIARRVVGGWAVVLLYLLLFAAVSARVRAWSGRAGWTDRHVLALAGGALMTYAWHAFVQAPVVGGQGALDHLGDAAFALLAAAVLATAALRSAGPATSRAGFSSSGRAI